MKKIVIFGANGMTGLAATEAAIERGLKVTAFVRDEGKLPSDIKYKLASIKVGDVTNPDQVSDAVAGQDGVIIALGPTKDLSTISQPTTVMSEGTRNILAAMKKHNVEPVSVVLSYYLFDPPGLPPATFLELHYDHERQHQVMKDSGLKWIAVMAPYIIEKPKSKYVVAFDKTIGETISKPDLADFLIDSLSEPKYYQRNVTLADV